MKPQVPIRIVIATDRQAVREVPAQILDREESTALTGVERGALADVTGPGRHGEGPALTKREHDILRSLSSGGTNKDIAKALCISEKTVKSHLNSVFRKLQVTRRVQAVLYAADRGWGASLDRT